MKLSTLNLAIENAIIDPTGVNSNEDFQNLLKVRDEITRLADICEDGLETDVSIVSWYAFSNLMNVATYDEFGKIRKTYLHNKRAQTNRYRQSCRQICEELTNVQIDGVADFLADLWDDNESSGGNAPDGTFLGKEARSAATKIDRLGDIINKLYHHRGLGPDDLSYIEEYIH